MGNNKMIAQNIRFSFFENCINSIPNDSVTVEEFLDMIKLGVFADSIDEYKGLLLSNSDEAAKYKRTQVPAVTYAGLFAKRNTESVVSPSGLIILDIDDIKEKSGLRAIKKLLSKDPYTFAVWVSPSGNGLKIAVKMYFGCSAETYKHRYLEVVNYYSKKYNIPIKDARKKKGEWGLDESCSDISRLCILSADDELYYNEDSEIFGSFSKYSNTELRVRSIIERVTDSKIDITATYQDWINIGFALNHEFGEGGREYFHAVSKFYEEYDEAKCNSKYSSFTPRGEGGITIATFFEIAKNYKLTANVSETDLITNDDEFVLVPESIPVTTFPTGIFSSVLKNFIEETARSINCPVDYVGVAVMAVISGTIGKKYTLEWKKGYELVANFYFSLIGDPGQKKSPAIAAACKILFYLQSLLRIKYVALKSQYKIDLQEYKEDKKNGGNLLPPTEPIEERLLASDLTLEALAVLLENNPKGLLLIYDELLLWFNSFNQYKAKGNDLQKWLSFWSGGDLIIDRKGEDSKIISNPFVTLIGCIQPDVLGMFSKRQNDGFLDRILFVYPELKVASFSEYEVSELTNNLYEQMVTDMVNNKSFEFLQNDCKTIPVIPTKEAFSKWVTWINGHHAEANMDDFPYYLKGVWSKMESHSLRFALLLFFSRKHSETDNTVEVVDIDGAIQLSEYFKGHMRRSFDIIYGSDEERKITQLVTYLRQVGGTDSVRNIIRKGIAGLKKVSETEAMLTEMEGRGIVKREYKKNKGGKPTILVHLIV